MSEKIYLVKELDQNDCSQDIIVGYSKSKEEAENIAKALESRSDAAIDQWNQYCAECQLEGNIYQSKDDAQKEYDHVLSSQNCNLKDLAIEKTGDSYEVICRNMVHPCEMYHAYSVEEVQQLEAQTIQGK